MSDRIANAPAVGSLWFARDERRDRRDRLYRVERVRAQTPLHVTTVPLADVVHLRGIVDGEECTCLLPAFHDSYTDDRTK